MFDAKTFRKRVLAREILAGTWLNLGSSITAEIAAQSGLAALRY
jgi:2-keto-3-deoxy-L-rhamnonate aldolase RhmA